MNEYIHVRINSQLKENFRTAARAQNPGLPENQAMSAVVREMIVEYVKKHGEEEKMEKITYLVQMVKGTDNAYDETATPRVLLKTTDKEKALRFFETLPKRQELEEPETDLEGNEKYESPMLLAVYENGEKEWEIGEYIRK